MESEKDTSGICKLCGREVGIAKTGIHAGQTKSCEWCGHREYMRAYNAKNRDKLKADFREYYQRTIGRRREYAREYHLANVERHRAGSRKSQLRRRHGITVEQYDAMVAGQNGLCAICGGIPNGSRLHLDHNHTTGAIRGLLCRPCNLELRRVENGWIDKALNYLNATRNAEPRPEFVGPRKHR